MERPLDLYHFTLKIGFETHHPLQKKLNYVLDLTELSFKEIVQGKVNLEDLVETTLKNAPVNLYEKD